MIRKLVTMTAPMNIMTHRKDIVALDGSMTLREAAHFVLKEAKNSRYPVYGKDLDDIIGTDDVVQIFSVDRISGILCLL